MAKSNSVADAETATNGHAEDGLATEAQRARRRRILDTAVELATDGGYDAVQMREVADRADVALGTLYRYFPSKVHLLVCAMACELAAIRDARRELHTVDGDPQDRVMAVVEDVMEVLAGNPLLSDAMVRAVM